MDAVEQCGTMNNYNKERIQTTCSFSISCDKTHVIANKQGTLRPRLHVAGYFRKRKFFPPY